MFRNLAERFLPLHHYHLTADPVSVKMQYCLPGYLFDVDVFHREGPIKKPTLKAPFSLVLSAIFVSVWNFLH